MPLMGIVAPRDPMWLSTLDAMDEELVSDSLVYRYNPSASPDGLRGSEGTFTLCSFFYVDALARSGRLDDARLTFEKMMTYANHLGLYAEEIGLTGEQLGNFPQAFSHLALINAAMNLDYQLDHGAGDVGRGVEQGRLRAQPERTLMSIDVDDIGPVDYLDVEFPGNRMTGEGFPMLLDLVDRGVIDVLDLAFFTEADDGSLASINSARAHAAIPSAKSCMRIPSQAVTYMPARSLTT